MSLRPATPVNLTEDWMLQFGCAPKLSSGRLIIPFASGFVQPPVVVHAPFWNGSGHQVGGIDTTIQVTADQFTVESGNARAQGDYFVSWIAFGPRRTPFVQAEMPYVVELEDMFIAGGNQPKPSTSIHPVFGVPSAAPPNIQVSPFLDRPVQNIETINEVGETSFSVSSDNRDNNHLVSWLSIGTRAGIAAKSAFSIGGTLIRIGKQAKVGHLINIPMDRGPGFSASPVVVISPQWEIAGHGVGHAETIVGVQAQSIDVRSMNERGEGDYFTSWLAIGS